jgi:lysophospholipase L1-like esterase
MTARPLLSVSPTAAVRTADALVGRRRILAILVGVMLNLACVEFALQVYSHLRTGQSIWTRVESGSEFVSVPGSALRVMRPNAVFRGSEKEIRTNSLGLRSPELPVEKLPGEYRVAVIGASSVMGAYAHSNADTVAAALERRMQHDLPGRTVHVINGGVAGADLGDQQLMLDYVAERLHPDVAIVYSGTNDFAAYCHTAPATVAQAPQFKLPMWVMTDDMLLKNTVPLRPAARAGHRKVDPRTLDLTPYRHRLQALVDDAQQRHITLLLATNARSYRPGQPAALQEKLAETARYYNACFDVAGLNTLYELHNDAIRQAAAARGIRLVEAGERIPGGAAHFSDSEHLNALGTDLLADLFADALREAGAPGRGDALP